MRSTDSYRVTEIFYSLQGEGFWTGTPAVFVRLSGCNRACPFCDTDFSSYTPMSADGIADAAAAYPARHVVVTGGEPLLQLDNALISRLKERGLYIHIETNGTLPVPEGVDWVTCSPKDPPLAIDRADELKIVFQNQDVEAIADDFAERLGVRNLFLQPCSGLNVRETIEYIMSHPRWRLSLQTHKLVGIQ